MMSAHLPAVIDEHMLCCPLCVREAKHPKVLPCLHIFCQTCLRGYIERWQQQQKDVINREQHISEEYLTFPDTPKSPKKFEFDLWNGKDRLRHHDGSQQQETQRDSGYEDSYMRRKLRRYKDRGVLNQQADYYRQRYKQNTVGQGHVQNGQDHVQKDQGQTHNGLHDDAGTRGHHDNIEPVSHHGNIDLIHHVDNISAPLYHNQSSDQLKINTNQHVDHRSHTGSIKTTDGDMTSAGYINGHNDDKDLPVFFSDNKSHKRSCSDNLHSVLQRVPSPGGSAHPRMKLTKTISSPLIRLTAHNGQNVSKTTGVVSTMVHMFERKSSISEEAPPMAKFRTKSQTKSQTSQASPLPLHQRPPPVYSHHMSRSKSHDISAIASDWSLIPRSTSLSTQDSNDSAIGSAETDKSLVFPTEPRIKPCVRREPSFTEDFYEGYEIPENLLRHRESEKRAVIFSRMAESGLYETLPGQPQVINNQDLQPKAKRRSKLRLSLDTSIPVPHNADSPSDHLYDEIPVLRQSRINTLPTSPVTSWLFSQGSTRSKDDHDIPQNRRSIRRHSSILDSYVTAGALASLSNDQNLNIDIPISRDDSNRISELYYLQMGEPPTTRHSRFSQQYMTMDGLREKHRVAKPKTPRLSREESGTSVDENGLVKVESIATLIRGLSVEFGGTPMLTEINIEEESTDVQEDITQEPKSPVIYANTPPTKPAKPHYNNTPPAQPQYSNSDTWKSQSTDPEPVKPEKLNTVIFQLDTDQPEYIKPDDVDLNKEKPDYIKADDVDLDTDQPEYISPDDLDLDTAIPIYDTPSSPQKNTVTKSSDTPQDIYDIPSSLSITKTTEQPEARNKDSVNDPERTLNGSEKTFKVTTDMVDLSVPCPTCTREFVVPGQQVSALKDCEFVSQLQEVVSSQKCEKKSCQHCDTRTAEYKCIDCFIDLCPGCQNGHNWSRSNRGHNVVTLRQLQSGKYQKDIMRVQKTVCQRDNTHDARYMCVQCNLVQCSDCVMLYCRNHRTQRLEAVAARDRDLIQTRLQDLQNRQETLHGAVDNLRTYERHCTTTQDDLLDQITSHQDYIRLLLDRSFDLLRSKVTQAIIAETQEVTKVRADVQTAVDTSSHVITFVNQLLEHGNHGNVVAMVPLVKEELVRQLSVSAPELSSQVEVKYAPCEVDFKAVQRLCGQVDQVTRPLGGSYHRTRDSQLMEHHTMYLELVREFNTRVPTDTKGCRPNGLAILPGGHLVVVDNINMKLKVFDAEGKLKREICPHGDHALVDPWDVAVLQNGTLAVTDKGTRDVKLFKQDGTFIASFGGHLRQPWGICTNSRGEILVTDTELRRVFVHNSSGKLLHTIPNQTAANTHKLKCPEYICGSSVDDIIISDFQNHCILVFDWLGRPLFKFGKKGTGRDEFHYPLGVTTDSLGNIFVVDYNNQRITVTRRNGQFLCCLMSQKPLNSLQALAIDKEGHLVAIDGSLLKIFKLPTSIFGNSNNITENVDRGNILILNNTEQYQPDSISIETTV